MSADPPPDDDPRPDAPPPKQGLRPGEIARSIGLGLLAFGATLILLYGFASLISRSTAGPGATERPTGTQPASSQPTAAVATATSPAATSSTASASSDPVLVGAGDISDCALDSGAATAALLDSIAGAVFTAGDNAYPNGTAAQFRDCYGPTWGRHLERTRPAAGNHDWETADLAGYRGYFGKAAGTDTASWYSYDLGAWHVIVLDADCSFVGCGPNSIQDRWLRADLDGTRAQCTLAIWHQPRFSSGEHGNDAAVWPFWDALYRAKADVVVNGHDHDYERFGPQDPAGREDLTSGIREFVVGTGGGELRPFKTVAAHSEVRLAGVFGVIRFVLHPTSYDWSFIEASGEIGDSGSGTCH
jgi:Calcineurin-like phosphoesterase